MKADAKGGERTNATNTGVTNTLVGPTPSSPPAALVDGHRDEHGLRQGWFRFYNAAGEVVATAHYRDDLLHGQVITLHNGQRIAELGYKDGLPDGPYRRLVHEGTYSLADARWEEGCFALGLPCGVFRLRAEDGSVVLDRDFGHAPTDDQTLRTCLLPGGSNDATHWFRYARSLVDQGRLAEALAAMARGVGVGGDPGVLRGVLERVVAPVTAEEADRRASAVRKSGSPRVLVASLLRGAEPAIVLRRLALIARGSASVVFLRAAVALREWPLSPIIARALREVATGDVRAVLQDAHTLALTHPEDAAALRILVSRRSRGEGAMLAGDERGDRPTIRRRDTLVRAVG